VIAIAANGPRPVPKLRSTRAPAAPDDVALGAPEVPLWDPDTDGLAEVVVLIPVEVPVPVGADDDPDAVPVEVPEAPGALIVAAAANRSVETKVLQLEDAGLLTDGREVTTAGCE